MEKILKDLALGSMIAPVSESDIDIILSNGKVMEYPITMKRMKRSSCHDNVYHLTTKSPVLQPYTGWALSDDGVWRQHSWAFDPRNETIIETTEPRELYFGILLRRK